MSLWAFSWFHALVDRMSIFSDLSPRAQNDVKLIWKTYGRHDMVITMICEKGCEGKAIFDFREKLVKLEITGFDYSIGFSWDKVDFSPY
jgi:hypothetical protein